MTRGALGATGPHHVLPRPADGLPTARRLSGSWRRGDTPERQMMQDASMPDRSDGLQMRARPSGTTAPAAAAGRLAGAAAVAVRGARLP
ncbi:MAG: hypothetical protein AAGA32_14615 [Pseudomonadota bacterium]